MIIQFDVDARSIKKVSTSNFEIVGIMVKQRRLQMTSRNISYEEVWLQEKEITNLLDIGQREITKDTDSR